MGYTEKGQRWVFHSQVTPEKGGDGIQRRVLAYCDAMMCVENSFKKGAVGPLHSHPHTQITYVASGAFSFEIEGETHIVRAGDTLLKTDGAMHGCQCMEEGILVDFFSPMREDFIHS